MLLIDRNMQLAPSAPGRNGVFLLVPFILFLCLKAATVDYYDAARRHRLAHQMPRQFNTAPGNAAEIGNGDVGLQDTGKCRHQAFRLT